MTSELPTQPKEDKNAVRSLKQALRGRPDLKEITDHEERMKQLERRSAERHSERIKYGPIATNDGRNR